MEILPLPGATDIMELDSSTSSGVDSSQAVNPEPARVRHLSRKESKMNERIVIPLDTHYSHQNGYRNNRIRTTKYTVWNIIPKNLFEQFHRFANVYFLFIVILNWVPQVQAFARELSMMPLLFVLAVTFVKDLWEDRRRGKQDKEANARMSQRYNPQTKSFVATEWRHLQAGDIVKIERNGIIPADLLLLWSSHPEGLCFIETANLDGETNLKQRRLFHDNDLPAEFDPSSFTSRLYCEHPNTKIYQFNGHIKLGEREYPLDTNNLLLRGCVVRNTASVFGMIVYAGHETKAMLNNTGPRSKRSLLERSMNFEVIFCCVILFVLCAIGGILNGFWVAARDYDDILYIGETEEPGLEGFIRFWTYFIILQVMVPISLYVSIELVKIFQVFFIQEDIQMYHEETDKKMMCRALNITEDLGQIEYIFSDKTGTLTQNKMVFHRCSAAGKEYPHSEPEEGKEFQDAFSFPTDKSLIEDIEKDAGEASENSSDLHSFMLSLAICNTVVPNNNAQTGEFIGFEAESPDEAALVSTAFVYDYKLMNRSNEKCVVSVNGVSHDYKVLNILEFDSTRKRMSVIVRLPSGQIRMFCKGADSAMYDILHDKVPQELRDATLKHLDVFARAGLRTLCFGYKDLDEGVFNDWNGRFQELNKAVVHDKKKKMRKLYLEVETEMNLLGATGIEDKLQDGVPDTIENLRRAGLKIWVLTGDKQETAIEIAYTCQLVSREMELVLLNCKRAHEKPKDANHANSVEQEVRQLVEQQHRHVAETKRTTKKEVALVIDGATLAFALRDGLKMDFLELACESKVVVICRATPLQKAQVVQLVKDNRKVMTLSIGDGANDVSMIQMAHVGVGISGQEGMQAVMASDFAIAQFRFLERLLLVHGHWNYDRLARMILYFFYKNALLVFVIFYFQISNGFSTENAIDQMYLQTFNLLWSSLPILATATFDQSVDSPTLIQRPNLYEQGMKNLSYKGKFKWAIIDAIYQSLIIYWVPYFAYFNDVQHGGLLIFGLAIYFSVLLSVTLHWSIITRIWTWVHWLFLVWSIIGCFVFTFIYHGINFGNPFIPDPYFSIFEACSHARFWLIIVLVPIVSVGPRFLVMLTTNWFRPEAPTYLRERHILQKRDNHAGCFKCPGMCRSAANALYPDEEAHIPPVTVKVRSNSRLTFAWDGADSSI